MLGITHGDAYKAIFDGQETIFGFDAGAGIEYNLSECLKLNADIKYQYNKKTKSVKIMGYSADYELKYDGPIFQIGLSYCF